MYRSLLVPLDGSDFGEHALPLALSLARRLGAALQVVHVHVPVLGVYGELGEPYDETTDRMLRERDRAYVDAIVQRLAAVAAIAPSSALLDGPVADAISRHATATGSDLLVMTTHGHGPLARFWLGSVADALVRQASIPILLVQPKEASPNLGQEPVVRRVLIPLDGSELAEQVLERALALGAATQAEYTLLRVVKQMTPASYDPASGRVSGLRESLLKQLQAMDRQQRTEAQNYLEHLAERLRARSLTAQTRVVSHEQPAAAILDDAQKSAVDLIALATQGRGGLKRMLMGSVADKVVRGATKPVLVYRPVDKSAPAEG
jgi:nucleotide-binding universal stress UspA family protein